MDRVALLPGGRLRANRDDVSTALLERIRLAHPHPRGVAASLEACPFLAKGRRLSIHSISAVANRSGSSKNGWCPLRSNTWSVRVWELHQDVAPQGAGDRVVVSPVGDEDRDAQGFGVAGDVPGRREGPHDVHEKAGAADPVGKDRGSVEAGVEEAHRRLGQDRLHDGSARGEPRQVLAQDALPVLRRVLLEEGVGHRRDSREIAEGRRAHGDHVGDAPRAPAAVLDGEHPQDRVPQHGDAIESQVDTDRIEVGGEDVEGEVRGVPRRPPAPPQIDVDEGQPFAQRGRRQALVGLRADAAQDETRGPLATGRIEEVCAPCRHVHGSSLSIVVVGPRNDEAPPLL